MSQALITESLLTDIADAIRAKLGANIPLRPGDMPAAIGHISANPALQTLVAFENSTYTPDIGYDGFDSVTVNVQSVELPFLKDTLLTPNNSTTYRLKKGRVVTGFQASHGYLAPYDNGWMDVDWTGSWEIGVAFKLDNLTGNFTLFGVENSTTYYAGAPSMEVSTSTLGRGISTSGASWTDWRNVATDLQANTWYFATMSFNPSTMIVTNRFTSDFSTYTDVTYTLSALPYHSASFKIGFGGLIHDSAHTKAGAHIDLFNTYIKVGGSIVWGAYSGEFPDF